jgi:hypothetical protein
MAYEDRVVPPPPGCVVTFDGDRERRVLRELCNTVSIGIDW